MFSAGNFGKEKKFKGFTLIELLIVVVVIGILTSVLVAVVDPKGTQNKAKDAGVKAAINKIALATEGYISAFGRVPNDVEFLKYLKNVSEFRYTCSDGSGNYECRFSVTGIDLPENCSITFWSQSGYAQCHFRYFGHPDSETFAIYAKSSGLKAIFKYRNDWGEIRHCNLDGQTNCVSP